MPLFLLQHPCVAAQLMSENGYFDREEPSGLLPSSTTLVAILRICVNCCSCFPFFFCRAFLRLPQSTVFSRLEPALKLCSRTERQHARPRSIACLLRRLEHCLFSYENLRLECSRDRTSAHLGSQYTNKASQSWGLRSIQMGSLLRSFTLYLRSTALSSSFSLHSPTSKSPGCCSCTAPAGCRYPARPQHVALPVRVAARPRCPKCPAARPWHPPGPSACSPRRVTHQPVSPLGPTRFRTRESAFCDYMLQPLANPACNPG